MLHGCQHWPLAEAMVAKFREHDEEEEDGVFSQEVRWTSVEVGFEGKGPFRQGQSKFLNS